MEMGGGMRTLVEKYEWGEERAMANRQCACGICTISQPTRLGDFNFTDGSIETDIQALGKSNRN